MHRNVLLLLLLVLTLILITSARPRKYRHRGRSGFSGFDRARKHREHRERHHRRDSSASDHWRDASAWDHWSDAVDRMPWLKTMLENIRYHSFDFDFDFGWHTREENLPWWEGPNVCKSEKETVENTTIADNGPISRHFSMHSQVCDESETSYKCTTKSGIFLRKKTIVKVFECCHGFTRKEGMFGCPTEFQLEDLLETAKDLGLSEYIRAMESVSLTDELQNGNFTIFAPVNKAFKNMKDIIPDFGILKDMPNVVMVSKPITDLVISDMSNVLLGHLVYDTIKTGSLSDEQLIETASPYNSEIRINFYSQPERVTTVNCARILSADNQATNGIIHTIDKVLHPVTETIIDFISKNPNMSFLKTALARADLVKTLRADGQFTMFAPTDDAFKKLEPGLKQILLKGDKTCLEKILKHHMLPSVICSTVIQGKVASPNLFKKYLNLTRTEDSKLFVDNSQIVVRDIMMTNGVIHVIEDVLIPDEARDLLYVAEKNELTEFIQLINETGIIKELKKMENVTIFIPTNSAFQKFGDEVSLESIKQDPEKLRELIMYHIVPEEVSCSRLHNNYQLETNVKEKNIRINGYSSFPFGRHSIKTAQCSQIVKQNIPSCNAVINIVDKVLLPPSGNVVDVLSSNKEFSTLLKLMKMSGLADMLQDEGPFTLFAPTNDAFESTLYEEDWEDLEDDKEMLLDTLKSHVVKGFICCASTNGVTPWFNVLMHTLSGSNISLRERQGNILFGKADVVQCDKTATNGVVHSIDTVIFSSVHQPDWLDHLPWLK